MKNIISILFFLLLPSTLFAGDVAFTVQSFKISCESPNQQLFCFAYINGVTNGYSLAVTISKQKPIYCIPDEGMTNGQARDIFLKWARENPKDYKWPAEAGITMSMAVTFPCAE